MNKTLPHKREIVGSGSEGMTIIELMVTLVIASIFAIAMYKVFETTSEMATRQNVNIDAQEGLRSSLNFMGKDLSMAGLATNAQGGLPGITIADDDRVRFWADRNADGTIQPGNVYGAGDTPEWLEYVVVANQLLVIPNPPADGSAADPANGIVLLENVDGMVLEYIDANGTRLPVPMTDGGANSGGRVNLKRIRAVEISLASTAANTATSDGRKLSMLKFIRCRNLGIWP